jgi:hypothetical protein
VHTGGEEIGDEEHASRTAGNAPECASGYVRLGELEETPLDDRIISRSGETRDQLVKVVVGGLLAATVRNHKHGDSCAGGHWRGFPHEFLRLEQRRARCLRLRINRSLVSMPWQHKGRSDRWWHDGVLPLDGFPDDLVEDEVIGAVLDLEVEPR